jgi:23S rRNA pseudouridine1911/1915/1917 synthase
MSSNPTPADPVEISVPPEHEGKRLDAFLASQFTQFSRVLIRKAINAGGVTVSGKRTKAAYRLQADELIVFTLPDMPVEGPIPEDIPLDILFEDDHFAAINKPPGMVVHPAKGHWAGTLTSALAFHFNTLSTAGGATRPGIVHRLDRDTSGVIVVAKQDQAHRALAKQFELRTTEKEYFALVAGEPDHDNDVIDRPIGVHPYQREKMTIRADHRTSRDARTLYYTLERFHGFAAIKVLPKTGRTHQIRVHLGSIGCPVLCDKQYGGRTRISRGEILDRRKDENIVLDRLGLHALRLRIKHPETGVEMDFEAPMPDDIQLALETLRLRKPK